MLMTKRKKLYNQKVLTKCSIHLWLKVLPKMKQGHVLILIRRHLWKNLHLAWNLMIKNWMLLFKIGEKKDVRSHHFYSTLYCWASSQCSKTWKINKLLESIRLEKTSKAFLYPQMTWLSRESDTIYIQIHEFGKVTDLWDHVGYDQYMKINLFLCPLKMNTWIKIPFTNCTGN